MNEKRRRDTRSAERRSRRHFTKSVGAALLTSVPLASSVRAQQKTPPAAETKAPPAAPPAPAAAPPSPLSEAYAEVARARFGARLTPAEWEKVREGIAGNVRAAERLSAFKLKNSDEPDFIFGV